VTIADTNVSVAYEETPDMFGSADGILGLAYAPLDDAFLMPPDTWVHKYTGMEVSHGQKHRETSPMETPESLLPPACRRRVYRFQT